MDNETITATKTKTMIIPIANVFIIITNGDGNVQMVSILNCALLTLFMPIALEQHLLTTGLPATFTNSSKI